MVVYEGEPEEELQWLPEETGKRAARAWIKGRGGAAVHALLAGQVRALALEPPLPEARPGHPQHAHGDGGAAAGAEPHGEGSAAARAPGDAKAK
eukprot:1854809-Pyramimonas_sp.AAC.1